MHRIRVDFHGGTLRLRTDDDPPGDVPRFNLAAVTSVPLTRDDRDDVLRCDALHAATLRRDLAAAPDIDVDWDVPGGASTPGDPWTVELVRRDAVRLRPDQHAALDDWRGGGCRGVVVMPTGTGKTVVAVEAMIALGVSTLVVVPVRDLMYQWHDRILDAVGVDTGLIGDGVHRVAPISVTTYDSAAIHMPRIGNRFELVVFDEAHHLTGRYRRDAARMSTAAYRLGLTATPPSDPERLAVLSTSIGPVVHEIPIDASRGDTLADYRVRRIPVRMTDDEAAAHKACSRIIQTFVADRLEEDADFRWDQIHAMVADGEADPILAAAARDAMIAHRRKRAIEENADAKMRTLEDLFRLHVGEPVLVFTGSNVMARRVATRFLVPCLLSHCGKSERRGYLKGFAEGRYPVLVANRVLDEGVDVPAVKVAIVIGGMSSPRQATQRLGRVLRRTDDGRPATLYEVVTEDSNEVQRSRDRRRTAAYRK